MICATRVCKYKSKPASHKSIGGYTHVKELAENSCREICK